MSIDELRSNFINYFVTVGFAKHDSSPIVPENDPSVLFTTAGMQQFKPYYLDPSLSPNKRLTSVQPVIRTTDIDEVGDDTHLTQFEMLGNFVFGERDMFALKQEAIRWAFKFIHKILEIDVSRIEATVFEGDAEVEADRDSEKIWQELGVSVRTAPRADNFWGPTGLEGPCGPTTEIYIDGVEVWNLVFNQYYQDTQGQLRPLEQCGLDTGSGLERLATVLQGANSIWQIEPYTSWLKILGGDTKENRIVVDHLKAAVFIISSGVVAGNKGRDYVLRRLIRRIAYLLRGAKDDIDSVLMKEILSYYSDLFLMRDYAAVSEVFNNEKALFNASLNAALREFDRYLQKSDDEPTKFAFKLYESHGIPKDQLHDLFGSNNLHFDNAEFDALFAKHQDVSRLGADKQFRGGLADHLPQTVKHHTATHLLLAALRKVLGDTVVQKGSNVTSERLRLDFNFDRKLTEDEIKEIEALVNKKIKEELDVECREMATDDALKLGAQAEFTHKYGERVSVYSIGDFSIELCGGPHVKNTRELGSFEILKEEPSSKGVRRIKAKLA